MFGYIHVFLRAQAGCAACNLLARHSAAPFLLRTLHLRGPGNLRGCQNAAQPDSFTSSSTHLETSASMSLYIVVASLGEVHQCIAVFDITAHKHTEARSFFQSSTVFFLVLLTLFPH